jgi:DNA-binding GntR family transcriptional regulator
MRAGLRQTDPLAPQLIASLRQSIADLRLRPGEALSEKDIALRYGVSRQPVREAFIKLSEAGLVEIRPSRGTFVMKISVRAVANARFVREAIEADIARCAGSLARPEQIEALRRNITSQERAAADDDYWRFNECDEAFHRAIADIVECDYAWRVVESARIQTDRIRYLSLSDASPMPLLISQHRDIVDRLEARDPNGAEAAMRRHLREILIALPNIAAAHPELFSDVVLPENCRALVPGDA